MIGLGATVDIAGEAGPGCEAGHGTGGAHLQYLRLERRSLAYALAE